MGTGTEREDPTLGTGCVPDGGWPLRDSRPRGVGVVSTRIPMFVVDGPGRPLVHLPSIYGLRFYPKPFDPGGTPPLSTSSPGWSR